ncbi:hypothetical protein PTI98_005565 [Pleurotus ostreatus]|nr:hypothetical protein PTI98_005565 [Pleurotus ostreatus]
MNVKHVYTVSAGLSGEFQWEYDAPPVSIPEATALHLGVVQLGLMGGVKVAMTVNANAEAKVTSTVQYGLQHYVNPTPPLSRLIIYYPHSVSTTIPPKRDTILTPYFNSTCAKLAP